MEGSIRMVRWLRVGPAAFLLAGLFTLGTPGAAAQEEAILTDPEGDPSLFFLPNPVPLPPNDATNPFDLLSLTISGEDELGLWFHMRVKSFKGLTGSTPFFGDDRIQYNLEAKLEGTNILYTIEWEPQVPGATDEVPKGTQPVRGRLCIENTDSDERFGGGCFEQPVDTQVNWDANTLEAYVTKDALVGRAASGFDTPPPRNLPATIHKGMQLGSLVATSEGNFPLFFQDRMPDSGTGAKAYLFKTNAANAKIRLSLHRTSVEVEIPPDEGPPGGGGEPGVPVGPPPQPNIVSVTPGVPTLVPLRIENTNQGKRLINLTSPEADAKWSFKIVPTLTVPGGDSRVINLIVNATKSVQHRETKTVVVYGKSLGFPDEMAAVKLTLVGSVPPSPTSKTLYFHGAEGERDPVTDAVCTALPFCSGFTTWLNTLESDADSTATDGIPMDGGFFFGESGETEFQQSFELDTPLVRDVLLDVDAPVEATIGIEASPATPGTMDVQIFAGGLLVGSASVSAEFKEGGSATVSFLPLLDAARIASGSTITCDVAIRVPLGGSGATTLLAGPTINTASSRIVLPIIEDPNATIVSSLPLGPAFVTLRPTDTLGEELLNPGRTKIFNATVTNEGVEADTVTVDATYDVEGWRVLIVPGTTFRLDPGESAKFGLYVTAAATAKEGDILNVVVNTTSGIDPRVTSQVRFTAVVTTGTDIPDEAGGFEVDDETAKKLSTGKSRGAPGLEAGFVLAGLLFTLFLGRRRRGRPGAETSTT